ncbi:MAG: CotH kinase family protein [Eubacterium sp.]|nr:CotH kinase family protein [Eubacterium sp.]MDD7210180.1 CotH kinase family protein [Lachnospiraceae bacterium]MDY5498282.1 CotH kinase family protein [Anaerobutyricum sp.]
MSAKANHLIICFYLDKQTEPFAQLGLKRQKRDGKWSETNQSVSIYDKKISGKHQISFKISSSDENDTENSFSVVLRSVTFAKSTVPVMYFDIDEQQGSIDGMNYSPEHDSECYGKVKIEIPDGYQCEYANDKGQTDNLKTATYDLEYIRGRGNSTWGTDKKPYKLKLQKKADLFNMGKNKHWVLLADYYDPTHMRNKMTYWLGQELGMEYTPQCVYVDVVMNGEYYGSYLLCEQVRIDKSRVDIDNLEDTPDATEEPTVTGGYLLSMCPQTLQEGKTFSTDRENEFQIESPEFEEEINEAQCDYIHNYVNDTEKAIYSPDFTDENGKSYKEYLDVASAIKYYWIQEFSGNGDGFISTSSYLYKKRDIENEKGKLFFGPLWDFDYVAWGNNDFDFYQCSDWVHRNSFWFDQLFKDDSFAEEVIQEWPELKNALNKICEDGGLLLLKDEIYCCT